MAQSRSERWTPFRFSIDEAWNSELGQTTPVACWWVEGPRWVFVEDDDIFMTEEDARLIAAAPELLGALERAVELFAGEGRGDARSISEAWLREARAVLAKVHGAAVNLEQRPAAPDRRYEASIGNSAERRGRTAVGSGS